MCVTICKYIVLAYVQIKYLGIPFPTLIAWKSQKHNLCEIYSRIFKASLKKWNSIEKITVISDEIETKRKQDSQMRMNEKNQILKFLPVFVMHGFSLVAG